MTAGRCGTFPRLAGVAMHGSPWGVSWPSRPPRARRCPGRIALLEANIARRPLAQHGYFRLVIAAPQRAGIARRDKCEGRDENRGDGRAPRAWIGRGSAVYIERRGLPGCRTAQRKWTITIPPRPRSVSPSTSAGLSMRTIGFIVRRFTSRQRYDSRILNGYGMAIASSS